MHIPMTRPAGLSYLRLQRLPWHLCVTGPTPLWMLRHHGEGSGLRQIAASPDEAVTLQLAQKISGC